MRTSIGVGNKVRRGNFIKKRQLYVKLKMKINLIPLGRLVDLGMASVLLNSWGKKRVCLLKKTLNILLQAPPFSIIFQREVEIEIR